MAPSSGGIGLIARAWRSAWARGALFSGVVAIAAGVLSVFLPRVYYSAAVIESGIMSVERTGVMTRNDGPTNLAAKIDRGALDGFVRADLGLDAREARCFRFIARAAVSPGPSDATPSLQVVVGCRSTSATLCQSALRSLIAGLGAQRAASHAYAEAGIGADLAARAQEMGQINSAMRLVAGAMAASQFAIAQAQSERRRLDGEIAGAAKAMADLDSRIAALSESLKGAQSEAETRPGEAGADALAASRPAPRRAPAANSGEAVLTELLEAQRLAIELSEARWERQDLASAIEQKRAATRQLEQTVVDQQRQMEMNRSQTETTYPQRKKQLETEIGELERKRSALAPIRVLEKPSTPTRVWPSRRKITLGASIVTAALWVLAVRLRSVFRQGMLEQRA